MSCRNKKLNGFHKIFFNKASYIEVNKSLINLFVVELVAICLYCRPYNLLVENKIEGVDG